MDQVSIDAQPRTALRKKTGALRRSGITPIHVYGRGTDSLTLQAETHALIQTLAKVGLTTPLTVKVGGDEHFVIVQKIQRHPVTEALLHVDLITVSRTERRQASVPLHFEGDAPATREEGAQLFEDLHALEVEALPTDIPSGLTVDLSALTTVESVIHASDIELPSNVTLVTDPTSLVARIVHRRGAEAGEPTEHAAGAAPAQAAPTPDAAAPTNAGGGAPSTT